MWLRRVFGQLNHKMRRYDTLPISNSNFANVLQAERIYCKCPVLPGDRSNGLQICSEEAPRARQCSRRA
jgi:hypothetical protein